LLVHVGKGKLFKGGHAVGDFLGVPADSGVDLAGVPEFPAMALGEIAFASILGVEPVYFIGGEPHIEKTE
jgi:hypothetical protein